MGEWSPECQRLEWADGAAGPVPGAKFVGHNRGGPRDLIRWSRRGRVLIADRGRELAFVTEEGGRESTEWRYRFEPVDGGTRVTESYKVKWIPAWARIVDVPTPSIRITGLPELAAHRDRARSAWPEADGPSPQAQPSLSVLRHLVQGSPKPRGTPSESL
jgi:hypothetical protein